MLHLPRFAIHVDVATYPIEPLRCHNHGSETAGEDRALPAAADVAEGYPAGDGEAGAFVVADQGLVAAGPAVEPELADPALGRLLEGGIEQGPADAGRVGA